MIQQCRHVQLADGAVTVIIVILIASTISDAP